MRITLPDTKDSLSLNIVIEVSSEWEQTITLSIDGNDYGTYSGSGERVLTRLDLIPGAARFCEVVCTHKQPGQAAAENAYEGPIAKQVDDAYSFGLLSYDHSRPKESGPTASVLFTWWR